MKDKIFNAIHSVLVIDNDGDSSISYHKSEVSNDYDTTVPIDYLNNVFKENPADIFSCPDIKNCITLILSNGREYPLNEYEKGMKPVFLKIQYITEDKQLCEIILFCNGFHYIHDGCMEWDYDISKKQYEDPDSEQYYRDAIKKMKNDYNGYNNSQIFLNKPHKTEFSAIHYCDSLKITLDGHEYHGYLPSIMQLKKLFVYSEMISYILKYMGFEPLKLHRYAWHSSSEYSMYFVWNIYEYYETRNTKTTKSKVFPFFKKIN